jgi:hypothetical protein
VNIGFIALLLFALLPGPALMRAQDAASPSPAASPSASPAPAPPVINARNSTVVLAPQLIALLPSPPPGWSADKPDGSTAESGGFQITTVGCVYVKGDADDAPTATLNLIDSANNRQFQDATKAMWGATSNTAAGYDKAVTVNGLPGFEHFTNADQTGVLWVVAGGRYFVQVETTHQPASELEGWLGRIDLKKLAALR